METVRQIRPRTLAKVNYFSAQNMFSGASAVFCQTQRQVRPPEDRTIVTLWNAVLIRMCDGTQQSHV